MRAYAHHFGEDEESWAIAGLLHDFDYERYPTLEDHPYKGANVLKVEGYSQDIIQAILGHANHTGVARESLMARTLFAVDELSGFVIALAKVRPGNFDGMDAQSVDRALKKKKFAAAISRDDIEQGIRELGVDRNEHFTKVIAALKTHAPDLGFSQ